MLLNGKVVRYDQLQQELATAGIVVPALGQTGDDLHTYDAAGAYLDLPAGAAPVVANHVPQATDDDNDRANRATLFQQCKQDYAVLTDTTTYPTLTQAQYRAMLAHILRLLWLVIQVIERRGL